MVGPGNSPVALVVDMLTNVIFKATMRPTVITAPTFLYVCLVN